ncbi:CoA-binding protein [Desulfotomaculum copahuensis]|uniref:CoA-binding protein n=1 Tax=Desulfotomaculum copahuensis TaxID=1838280 RepID=A0A1B7LJN0_9FIRM|nr:CoA-binding protein [Desulfotomaculum copahuensis]
MPDGFLTPRSIALVGVSTRTGPAVFNVIDQVLAGGFTGRIYPVNPRGGELRGLPVYRSVSEIPEVVDLAVISTPRTAVPEIVRECAARGVKAVIVITQGFADADEAGHRLQEELLQAVSGTGTRLVGPNTIGVVNLYDHLNTSFIEFTRQPADTATICQSGIFLLGSADFTCGIGLGVDIGNAADIDFNQTLAALGTDSRIRVLNLHMEGLADGRRFMEIARQVSREKPVLCLKTGRSEAGARAASSHSGSLAGEDHVFGAAFKQCGVIRVRDVEEMRYFNKTFLTYRSMPGRRLAVVTISGGAGIAAVDACGDYGLEAARFSAQTNDKLAAVFPGWMEVGNPADIWPAGMSRGYREVLELALDTILDDPQVDALLMISPAYVDPDADPRLDISAHVNRAAARHPDKPLALWIFGAYRRELTARMEAAGRVAVYPSPDRAVASLAVLYRYVHGIKNAPAALPADTGGINRELVGQILAAARRDGRTTLNEEALDVLRACGIPALPYTPAIDGAGAVRAAADFGYPVVMKIASPQISHKSDVGGVKVNLTGAAEVRAAYDDMLHTVKERMPQARINGVIIQPYRPGGTEVILGSKRDPSFGPVLVYGLGGIYTELFRDVSFRIAPITGEEAREMIRETKSYRLLSGFRGRPPADLDALAECLLRLGRLVAVQPQIREMDINPLLAGPDGAVAVDARITIDNHTGEETPEQK